MSNFITEPDIYDCEIAIIAEAFALRDLAIKESESIETVENLFEANQAAIAMKSLAELAKGIEASRKSAKEPALHIGRKIDGIAKDFIERVVSEKSRLQLILGAYQRVEAQKKRDAEKAARREEQRILDEARAKQEARIAEESKGRTGKLNDDIDDIIDDSDKAVAVVKQEAANSHNAVAGLRVRKSMKFEIKDVAELMAARPDLFSPDESKIRAAIKLTQSIPGLDIWEESKAY